MLSDRRQLVLRALIEEYVSYALPVGSRTLVERYDLGCSSATIRNELSRLEEEGYLCQPHTSAGRIPTDHGYRAFVDDLLATMDDDEPLDGSIAELRQAAREVDELFEKTSAALTKLTDCLAFVVPPRMLTTHVKVVNVVQLSDHRLILVVVTDEGQVLNRQVDVREVIDPVSVIRVQEALNNLVAGKHIGRDGKGMPLHREASADPLFRLLVEELYVLITEHREKRPYRLGMTNLMAQPEFSSSSSLLPVLAELEDDTVLLHVLDDVSGSDRPVVRIGHENGSAALSGVSLVASRFGEGDQMGLVAILGPTRMNYSQVLRAVQAAKGVLREY